MVNKRIYVNTPSIFLFIYLLLVGGRGEGAGETKYFRRINCKSSCPKMFYKKGILKNFAKFTGKYLRRNLYFISVIGLQTLEVAGYKPLVSLLML